DGVNVPVGAHSVFYYAAEAFNDFTLRLQFRLSGPIGNTGRPIDNSGIFLRFHAPHSKGPDLPTNADPALQQNVISDAAWVAAYTGSKSRSTRMPHPTVLTSTELGPSTTYRLDFRDCRTSRHRQP